MTESTPDLIKLTESSGRDSLLTQTPKSKAGTKFAKNAKHRAMMHGWDSFFLDDMNGKMSHYKNATIKNDYNIRTTRKGKGCFPQIIYPGKDKKNLSGFSGGLCRIFVRVNP